MPQNVEMVGELCRWILNSPQRDDALLREAGVALDRALFPLLAGLGKQGPLGVAKRRHA